METGTTEKEREATAGQESQADQNPDWFQDFVDNYDYDRPQRGEILKGVILDIGDNSILLDVGLKRDAIVTSQDLDKVDQDILDDLESGDEVFVSVIRTPVGDDDLLVSLNRGIAYESWVKAEEYMEADELLELEIIDQNKGGLLVEFENLRGFVPNSHIPSLRRGSSKKKANEVKAEMIGDILPVKVIEVNRKQRRLVFSARVAQREQRERRLKELEVGDVIESRVVNVVDFGVFVDLDGVDGLVHKSEIAWDRVYDPSKHFSVGDEIEVKVVDIDVERERVSLSRKSLLPNPWEKLEDTYDVGDLVEGKVVSVLDFGAFVELPEGLQGLVHVSEIGYANMGDPESVVQEGDKVLVRILSIEPDRERVSLSMRRVPVDEQMAWMMEEDEENLPDMDIEAAEEMMEEGEAEDVSEAADEGEAEETLEEGEELEDEVEETLEEGEELEDEAEETLDEGEEPEDEAEETLDLDESVSESGEEVEEAAADQETDSEEAEGGEEEEAQTTADDDPEEVVEAEADEATESDEDRHQEDDDEGDNDQEIPQNELEEEDTSAGEEVRDDEEEDAEEEQDKEEEED